MDKITDAQIAQYGVQASPDKLQGTPAENKQVFDRLISNAVKSSVNGIIDDISAATGAALLGAKDSSEAASTVQAELDKRVEKVTGKGLSTNDFTDTLKNKLDALPEGSNILAKDNTTAFTPSGDYNPATKKYIDDKVIAAGAITSVFGRTGDVAAQAGDYSAALITYGNSNVGEALNTVNPRLTTITLTAAGWTEQEDGSFSQSVAPTDLAEDDKVDLQLSVAQVLQLIDDGTVGLIADNTQLGTVTISCTGASPTVDLNVQETMTHTTGGA